MRVTSETMVMRSLDRLRARLEAVEGAQTSLSTGRTMQRPSDDPSAARRALSVRSAVRTADQQLRNANEARGWLDSTDQQLQSAINRLQRVRELAVRGSTMSSTVEHGSLAAEVRSIRAELVDIANVSHLGQSLFGGYATGHAVEQVDGEWLAHGTHEAVTRRVGHDELVRVNVTAGEWLGFDDDGPDTLTLLGGLADALDARDPALVGAQLSGIDDAIGRVGEGLAAVGASTRRVDAARERVQNELHTLRVQLSSIEDVDLAEGIMELQTQQVAYEATLQTLARALPPSLASFLR